MLIDGRQLARHILDQVRLEVDQLQQAPLLTVFTCEPNFETQKFLALKKRRAEQVGITIQVVAVPASVTTADMTALVQGVLSASDGVIIQFPFPHLKTGDLIPLIPATHDVDVMQYGGWLHDPLPPVVGAIDAIANHIRLDWQDKSVVVVGNGRLVGAPAFQFVQSSGAWVTLVTKERDNVDATKEADIVILGAGHPGLLTSEMVKDGVVVFDAGTSEEGGMLVGDADSTVADKAAYFTPVPGGIGPLTVAILLKNVLYLAKQHRK